MHCIGLGGLPAPWPERHSVRLVRWEVGQEARRRGCSPCSAHLGSRPAPGPLHPPSRQGRRLFVFIVGGVTLSEMRCAHRLSAKLGRDVFLGGTSEWRAGGGGWLVIQQSTAVWHCSAVLGSRVCIRW